MTEQRAHDTAIRHHIHDGHRHGSHGHDWLSADYVADWIARDLTRDGTRRPELEQMARWITADRQEPVRVLDVGGGYGVVTSAVLDTLPKATVVWQDYSPPMLAEARDRLARYGDRVEFRVADLADTGWADGLGGPFDAVVSARAIHNLFDGELITRVYRDVHEVLRPGGVFLNADLVFPTGTLVADLYTRGQSPPRSRGPFHESGGLANQLRWLCEAGFTEVDCVVKNLERTVLCGYRAS